MLLVNLRRRIHVARLKARVLTDRLGVERSSAFRTGGLEATLLQILNTAGMRMHDAVGRAAVAPLAVDDHARGEHQPARRLQLCHLAKQHCGAGVVVADVVDNVEELAAEADHPGLVAHAVHATQRPPDGRGVAYVALHEVDLARQVVGALAMGRKRVEYADLLPLTQEGVDYVRADEPGPSGHEDQRLAPQRPVSALGFFCGAIIWQWSGAALPILGS